MNPIVHNVSVEKSYLPVMKCMVNDPYIRSVASEVFNLWAGTHKGTNYVNVMLKWFCFIDHQYVLIVCLYWHCNENVKWVVGHPGTELSIRA